MAIETPVDTEQPVPKMLLSIRHAFEQFDDQSARLEASFERLQENLAAANRELNAKNRILSGKVAELQQVSSRLHCILESLADGVLVVNHHYRIERCNPAAEHLLGLDRIRIERQPYRKVMKAYGSMRRLRAAVEKGTITLDEQRASVSVGDASRVVLASVAPIRGAGGSILGAVEVLRDVTKLRMLEERVHHQKQLAALGEMAASVAHEIRNPLGTIEGFARLLRRDLEHMGQSDTSRLASKIIEGAVNLNYVITNLLTYARPMTLAAESILVTSMLDELRDVLDPYAKEHGVAMRVALPNEPMPLRADARQLRQVLINLCRNAVEACDREGTVELRAYAQKRRAVFEVWDNGVGIAPEEQTSIFNPFYTTKQAGTGLGLSLCHKIVEAHGGEIRVSSQPGQGTTFTVCILQEEGGL